MVCYLLKTSARSDYELTSLGSCRWLLKGEAWFLSYGDYVLGKSKCLVVCLGKDERRAGLSTDLLRDSLPESCEL